MAGIWDFLTNAGGLLGNLGQPGSAPGQPRPTPVVDYLRNNPAMIANLAAGIGGAPNMRMGLAQAAQGMPGAMASDRQFQDQQGQKKAVSEYFGDPANTANLTAGQRAFLAKYPAIAEKYIGNALVPPMTQDIQEYNFAKQQGYAGSFQEYMTKVKGASGAQESTFGSPIFRFDENNKAIGYDLFTNRGTVYHYDASGQFAGESRVPGGGAPGAPGAPGSAGPSPPGAPPQIAPPNGGPVPAPAVTAPQPPVAGSVRPPGSVKFGNQGTQLQMVTPGGQNIGTLPVYNAQEAADKKAGADQATDLNNVNTSAIKSTTQKNSIALMRQAASDPNFYSGAFADQVLAMRKLGVALGMDPGAAASMENFQSMSNQLVKDRLGSLGTGVSNADVGFISRTVPTLEATPKGNQQLLDILEQLANRDIEVAKVAQQYAKDHGGGTRLDANWSSYLAEWAQTHPLFGASGAGAPAALPPGVTIRQLP